MHRGAHPAEWLACCDSRHRNRSCTRVATCGVHRDSSFSFLANDADTVNRAPRDRRNRDRQMRGTAFSAGLLPICRPTALEN
jgi:hypothetical protein